VPAELEGHRGKSEHGEPSDGHTHNYHHDRRHVAEANSLLARASGLKQSCQIWRTAKEAPLFNVELNVDMNAANNSAMARPPIPVGSTSCSTTGMISSESYALTSHRPDMAHQ